LRPGNDDASGKTGFSPHPVFNFRQPHTGGGEGSGGHSGALLRAIADATESISDVFSSLVVYIGLRVAIRPPDADHPYGHGKAEPMAAPWWRWFYSRRAWRSPLKAFIKY
jgi:Predicted Co/Zn/Cd cation transporters